MGKNIVNNTLKLTNDENVLSEFYNRLEGLYILAYEIEQSKTKTRALNYEEFIKQHKELSGFIAKHSAEPITNPMTKTNLERKFSQEDKDVENPSMPLASPELKATLVDIGNEDGANRYDGDRTSQNIAILLSPIENNPIDALKDMDMDFSQLKLEDFHKRISEKLLNQQIESQFSSIESLDRKTELEGYLVNALSDIEKKYQAEMLSPIVTYCDKILKTDIDNKVFKNPPPDPHEIVSRVSELTFTVTGSEKDDNVKVEGTFVQDGDQWKLNGAGSSIVDSILINPYKKRLIGHSTTVDTSGDIEKDQLYRHPFKVFKINDIFKDQANFPADISQISKESEREIKLIQKWGVDKTYEEMKSHFDIDGDGKIDASHIEEIYKDIDYSFDAFGDLLSTNENPIIKIIKLVGLLEYQESQANKKDFTPEAIKMIRKKIIVKAKGFFGFDEIYQKLEAEQDNPQEPSTMELLLLLIADAMEIACQLEILNEHFSIKSNEYYEAEGNGFKDSIKGRLKALVNSCKKLFEDNDKLNIASILKDDDVFINSIVPKLLNFIQTKTYSSHVGALLISASTEGLLSLESHKNVYAGKGLHNENQINILKKDKEIEEKDMAAEREKLHNHVLISSSFQSCRIDDEIFEKKEEYGETLWELRNGQESALISKMFLIIEDEDKKQENLKEFLCDKAPTLYVAYKKELSLISEAEDFVTDLAEKIEDESVVDDIVKKINGGFPEKYILEVVNNTIREMVEGRLNLKRKPNTVSNNNNNKHIANDA